MGISGDQETDQVKEAAVEDTATTARALTWKSIAFGLLGLLFTICYTAFNDLHLRQTSFIANHLPPGPLFLVVAIAVLWNPFWTIRWVYCLLGAVLWFLSWTYLCFVEGMSFWVSWHWLILLVLLGLGSSPLWAAAKNYVVLNTRELLVALLIIFAGCWTAGAGLNYFFSTTQVGMWKAYSNDRYMQDMQTIEYIPSHVWPAGGLSAIDEEEKRRVYDAFVSGSEQQGAVGVPWDAWMPSLLLTWFPLFILFALSLISLSLIVHRQWSQHEQLSYPIAQIGSSLIEKTATRHFPEIFYNKLFWIGTALVVSFHGVRYLHVWFPSNFPNIETSTYFNFLLNIFPTLKDSGVFSVHYFNLFFSIIGVCYFLPREIGLTLGIAPFILAIFGAQVYLSTGSTIGSADHSGIRVGAYIAYALTILYTGRHYYWNVLRKSFTFKAVEGYERDGIFAARVLMVSVLGLIVLLTWSFELDLPIAVLFCLTGLLLFLVFTRIICETGVPYLQAAWDPGACLISVFGVGTIGAAPLVILYYVSSMLFVDPKESLMPFVSNGLKMAESTKLRLKSICMVMMVVAGLAIPVSIGVRLYQQYHMGGHELTYTWADKNVPTNILNNASRDLSHLADIGQKHEPGVAAPTSFWGRLGDLSPDGRMLSFMSLGFIGVVVFFFLRFRFPGFMLHPVLFLIIGITPNARTFYSFLIGWIIRECIVRFGGGKVHTHLKPLFIGLIFAELFMGVFGMGVGLLYYVYSGFSDIAPAFKVILG